MIIIKYIKIMVNNHNRCVYRKIFLNKGNEFLIEGESMILRKQRKDILNSGHLYILFFSYPITTEKQSRCLSPFFKEGEKYK